MPTSDLIHGGGGGGGGGGGDQCDGRVHRRMQGTEYATHELARAHQELCAYPCKRLREGSKRRPRQGDILWSTPFAAVEAACPEARLVPVSQWEDGAEGRARGVSTPSIS